LEGEFGCSQLSYEVESITTTSATLIATIDSSDYKAIDQMGFMVAVGDSTDFDLYPTAISRIIELKLDDLTPNTEYTFKSFVRAKGEEWQFECGKFTTLSEPEPEPTPEPEPKPEPKPEPEVVLNEDIKFTFEVVSVEVNTAKIKISHDGTSSDTWYGFATTNSNVTKAITEKHAELTAAGNIKGLRKQTSFTDTINELAPETEYTYIAFGITADGTLYGQPASIKFTTEREAGKIEETNTWTITYDGRGENQGEEVELFSIE
jgi:hypothetical protein